MPKVAIVRGRWIEEGEIANYERIEGHDVTLFGADGTTYDGPLDYETLPSAATAPSGLARKGAQVITGLVNGADSYLYGLVDALEGYDVVHVVETYHGFSSQAIEAKESHDCAVVCTVWENIPYFLEGGHYSRDIRTRVTRADAERIKSRVRDRTDLFLPVTEQAAFALRTEGVEDDRLRRVPVGVDVDRFHPGRLAETDTSPSDYGFSDDAVNVAFVGRTPWKKGVFDLLSAWKAVEREADRAVRLSIVGATDNRERLRRYADYTGLSRAHVRGRVPYDEVSVVMDSADVLVLPSIPTRYWQEQYGRVVPEAQACETAVVASDTGGVSDAAGGIGEFVPAGDAMSIARSLLDVVEDEERRERLAERGHERVRSELTLDHTARAVESAYQAALE